MRLGWLLAALVMPVLAYAQAPGAPRCAMDVEIGGRCASDWMIRAFVASAAIVLIGVAWRAVTTRAGRRDWDVERGLNDQRGAALGDLGPLAAKDPAEAARRLQRSLGTEAASYAKRERHRAFQQGDIAAAGAWQNVERMIERQAGAD
jgi:hypothetical protein